MKTIKNRSRKILQTLENKEKIVYNAIGKIKKKDKNKKIFLTRFNPKKGTMAKC